MSAPEPTRVDGDIVEVAAPADVAYVSTLRLTAASLAARCELTIDDIEDLRLAVDEACALLLPHASQDSRLAARFELATARLQVAVSVSTLDAAEPDRDGFGWTVLGALASSVDVVKEDAQLTISVVKAREAAQT